MGASAITREWPLSPACFHHAYDIHWTSRFAQDLPIHIYIYIYRVAPLLLSCNQLYKTLSSFVCNKSTNSSNAQTWSVSPASIAGVTRSVL